MKTIIVIFVGLFSLNMFAAGKAAAPAAAAPAAATKFSRPWGMAGCGLGSVIIGKKGAQIFASTTNGSTSNQLFGITSGTLNCLDGSENQVAQKSDFYIQANRMALQGDIARGNGETLSGLSRVMGCDAKTFGPALQQNYGEIFNSENVAPNEVTDAIITVIKSNQTLSNQCHLG